MSNLKDFLYVHVTGAIMKARTSIEIDLPSCCTVNNLKGFLCMLQGVFTKVHTSLETGLESFSIVESEHTLSNLKTLIHSFGKYHRILGGKPKCVRILTTGRF